MKEGKKTAILRFYGELNYFLPDSVWHRPFYYSFYENPTFSDLMDSFKIPPEKIGLLLLDGEVVELSCPLKEGSRATFYPRFQNIDISEEISASKKPVVSPRFILPLNLGKLTKYLRMLGFDSICEPDFIPGKVDVLAMQEGRVLLSRSKKFAARKLYAECYVVKSEQPAIQVREVVNRFNLMPLVKYFQRCLKCNSPLKVMEKSEIYSRLLPYIRKNFNLFFICPGCDRVYWMGTHYKKMKEKIETILHTTAIA
ncbi:Mut7-C RNAse domain-containing protein [Candidatus Riflebacteria bacterium]